MDGPMLNGQKGVRYRNDSDEEEAREFHRVFHGEAGDVGATGRVQESQSPERGLTGRRTPQVFNSPLPIPLV